MRTTYLLQIKTECIHDLLVKWRNLGWDGTCISQNLQTSIVYLDMVVEKNTDPTSLPGVIEILQ